MPPNRPGELVDASPPDPAGMSQHMPAAIAVMTAHGISCHPAITPMIEEHTRKPPELHMVDRKVGRNGILGQRRQHMHLKFPAIHPQGGQERPSKRDVKKQRLGCIALARRPVKAQDHEEVGPRPAISRCPVVGTATDGLNLRRYGGHRLPHSLEPRPFNPIMVLEEEDPVDVSRQLRNSSPHVEGCFARKPQHPGPRDSDCCGIFRAAAEHRELHVRRQFGQLREHARDLAKRISSHQKQVDRWAAFTSTKLINSERWIGYMHEWLAGG